jgi:hypothetical protein
VLKKSKIIISSAGGYIFRIVFVRFSISISNRMGAFPVFGDFFNTIGELQPGWR